MDGILIPSKEYDRESSTQKVNYQKQHRKEVDCMQQTHREIKKQKKMNVRGWRA